MAELVKEFTVENDPSEPLFDIFVNTLDGISTGANTTIRLLAFEIKMLKILGYLPEWGCCVSCKTGIQEMTEVHFNAKEGGVLCKRCHVKCTHGIFVPAGAILIAKRLADANFQKIERVTIQLSICVEIEKMLRYYIASILNKGLNSWKYLKVS